MTDGVPNGSESEPAAAGVRRPPSLLFDTTAIVDLYRGRPEIRPRFDAVVAGEIQGHISVVSEAELWRGLRADEVERHEALLSFFVALPLSSEAARQAGTWMQRFFASGLGWMDALIVASGAEVALPVLTRDLKLAQCLDGEADFQTYRLSV